jgi:hypothetical protein
MNIRNEIIEIFGFDPGEAYIIADLNKDKMKAIDDFNWNRHKWECIGSLKNGSFGSYITYYRCNNCGNLGRFISESLYTHKHIKMETDLSCDERVIKDIIE